MNIKKIVLKYKQVAFVCGSLKELEIFINDATKNILFNKAGVFIEDKDYIIKHYIPNLVEGKCYALICLNYNKNKKLEHFNFYARDSHVKYSDWDQYTIVNYSKEIRKRKLKNLHI